jgi:small-conductance mechanosensitive channel
MFDRPFRRGDTIRYGTTTGTVERIGLKTTRMRAQSGEQVIMANTKLLEQELHNLAEATVRRVTLPMALTYQIAPDTIAELPALLTPVVTAIKGCRLVRAAATGFGPSSIDVELVYDDRTTDPDKLAAHKSAIISGVMQAFAARGIAFAYPTQTTFTAAPDGTLVMPWVSPTPAPQAAAK